MEIKLEFGGGAELLCGGEKKRVLSLERREKPWTIADLLARMKESVITERPELFLQQGSVRPGILVLVNDTDWELVAVEECAKKLESVGFKEVKETDDWESKPLTKMFMRKNRSSLVAWAVGGKFEPGSGNSIIAAHTDSPCLRVKPVSKLESEGFIQVGVQPYGGGLWRTWFDRDLTVAGRVVYKEGGQLKQALVHVGRPILSIPNLAIHLELDREKFVFKKEEHLKPILASLLADRLNSTDSNTTSTSSDTDTHKSKKSKGRLDGSVSGEHCPAFLKLIAETAGVAPEAIRDMELNLLDVQPAAITGLYEEFVSGGRLDNLVGTYTAVWGLADSLNDSFANDTNVRMAVCFDNEEGAMSSMLEWILRRLHPGRFEASVARSLLVSADQAHACHPNYAIKHETNHKVGFHEGVVIKVNPNQRYATTALTHAVMKEIAERARVPLQKIVVPNDSPCGSTVGPILSAKLGMATIDLGTTQLAMHSAREICDTSGIAHARALYKKFYEDLPSVLAKTDL